jgi:energy-coupling factor transport system ATP-binding protein
MLIRVEHLSYTYAPHTPLASAALCDVSLELAAGECVGILGPSGSGKSTLAQLLAGLFEPASGQVLLNGVAAHERSAAARAQRRHIGLALQRPEDQIFEQTVFKEVAFGPRNQGLAEAEIVERVDWALDMVGFDSSLAERNPLALSGGEMRRLALAGILAMRPEVLILDEPTAGLDPRGRADLLSRLGAWQQATGLTLVIVSHNMDELAHIVERVVLLDGGRVIADGPSRRLLSDVPLLHAIGLDVPQPVALLRALRKAGWPVPTDRLLPEEAVAEIVRARRLIMPGMACRAFETPG